MNQVVIKGIFFASAEGVVAFYTALLLLVHMMHRKSSPTRRPLALLLINQFFLMLTQVAEWSISVYANGGAIPKPLLTWFNMLSVCDFLFYALGAAFYYNYVSYVIGATDATKRVFWGMIWVSGVSTVLFGQSFRTGLFFTMVPDGTMLLNGSYWLLILGNVAITMINVFIILRNSKSLGWAQTVAFLSVPLIPFAMVIVDQLYSLAFSYLTAAVLNTIIYLSTDLTREMKLLDSEAKLARIETQAVEARSQVMVSQIQPHFIFNTLSTISYLCKTDPQEANLATIDFAEFLKGNLRTLQSEQPISFADELKHLKHYIRIQNRRFVDTMRVEYDIQTEDFFITPLSIQPLVENSIRHGVEQSYDVTTITIRTEETEDAYVITVQDDGPGFDTNQPPKKDRPHIGVPAVKSRLKRILSGELVIESAPGEGTTVTITLPKEAQR